MGYSNGYDAGFADAIDALKKGRLPKEFLPDSAPEKSGFDLVFEGDPPLALLGHSGVLVSDTLNFVMATYGEDEEHYWDWTIDGYTEDGYCGSTTAKDSVEVQDVTQEQGYTQFRAEPLYGCTLYGDSQDAFWGETEGDGPSIDMVVDSIEADDGSTYTRSVVVHEAGHPENTGYLYYYKDDWGGGDVRWNYSHCELAWAGYPSYLYDVPWELSEITVGQEITTGSSRIVSVYLTRTNRMTASPESIIVPQGRSLMALDASGLPQGVAPPAPAGVTLTGDTWPASAGKYLILLERSGSQVKVTSRRLDASQAAR